MYFYFILETFNLNVEERGRSGEIFIATFLFGLLHLLTETASDVWILDNVC